VVFVLHVFYISYLSQGWDMGSLGWSSGRDVSFCFVSRDNHGVYHIWREKGHEGNTNWDGALEMNTDGALHSRMNNMDRVYFLVLVFLVHLK
jgi:hypothetical protein